MNRFSTTLFAAVFCVFVLWFPLCSQTTIHFKNGGEAEAEKISLSKRAIHYTKIGSIDQRLWKASTDEIDSIVFNGETVQFIQKPKLFSSDTIRHIFGCNLAGFERKNLDFHYEYLFLKPRIGVQVRQLLTYRNPGSFSDQLLEPLWETTLSGRYYLNRFPYRLLGVSLSTGLQFGEIRGTNLFGTPANAIYSPYYDYYFTGIHFNLGLNVRFWKYGLFFSELGSSFNRAWYQGETESLLYWNIRLGISVTF